MTGARRPLPPRERVRAGFIPLVDAAPLLVASRLGFAGAEELEIELLRETSWATLRDRIAVRHLDVAHMLGAMPIADRLGLTPLPADLIAPMALGFGGNTITVSLAVQGELGIHGADGLDAATGARAMASLVGERRRRGAPALTFAIVHAHSAHHYQLAYWLAWAGLRPGNDVELVVIPPSLMTAALSGGQIDGFCAGEPWGSVAAAEGVGHILTTSASIWQRSPDKVLGVRRAFAEERPARLERLLRAIYRAAVWCDDPANRSELCELLAGPDLVGQPAGIIGWSIDRRLAVKPGEESVGSGFLAFAADGGTFPWISHAGWLYAQMVRWGQAPLTEAGATAAFQAFRPDLYRAALAPLGIALPADDRKREGAHPSRGRIATVSGDLAFGPDAFFDRSTFDPDRIGEYVASFPVRAY